MKKKTLLFFSFLSILHLSVISQINPYGTSIIKNYTIKDYNANSQNWAVAQDHRGVMYFGNVDGVLEYDGINWNTIEIRNKAIVYSLAIDRNGRIYVGAEQEFGYIEPNENGILTYYSISEKYLQDFDVFFKIWKTYVLNEEVYFCYYNYIFKYNYKKSTLKIIETGKYGFFSFLANNTIYHSDYNKGLMKLQGDSLVLCLGGDFFKKEDIWAITPFRKNELMIINSSKLFYIYNEITGEVKEFEKDLYADTRDYIIENDIYNAIEIDSNKYLIGSLWGGMLITDKRGKTIEKIEKNHGLQDASILFSFFPKHNNENNSWLALGNGISKIETNSPFRHFDEHYNIEGSVLDIIRYNNSLYVASDNGVYVLSEKNNESSFKKVNNTFGLCGDFIIYDKHLLVASEDIFIINGENTKVNPIDDVVFNLFISNDEKSNILATQVEGLIILEYEKNSIIKKEKVKGISVKIESIEDDAEGNFWFKTESKGFYMMKKNKQVTLYDSSAGLPSDYVNTKFFKYGKDLYFATPKGIMEFIDGRFVRSNRFNPSIHHIASNSDNIFKVADNKWYFNYCGEGKTYLIKAEAKGQGFSIDSTTYKRLPQMNYYAVYEDENNITWIGTSEGLYSYNNNEKFKISSSFSCLIRKVYLNGDSTIFAGNFMNQDSSSILKHQPEHVLSTINYKYNSIAFHFASPYFVEEQETQYSYMLKGFDNTWSNWDKKTYKEYTSLPEGKYTFMAKAKNIYGIESEVAMYKFTITPPWYRTVWAYTGYGILFIVFVWFLVRMNTYRLQREKVRLEKIVKERTKEISEQRDQLKDLNAVIAKKNENITASIRYAKRIQGTIMPSEERVKEILPESFILFKPKDIVSGDFYFCEQANNKIVFSAVDCTGHGVPGAFVSMVGSSWLHRALKEEGLIKPDEIMNYLNNGVYTSLRKDSDSDVKDGMDLALVSIDLEKMKGAFAGAYNPMFLIRDREVEQFKADVFAVGSPFTEKFPTFTCQEFDLKKGDSIYVFSDGYIDQFGGPKRKKFMKKRFRELLISIQDKTMEEQKGILDTSIEEWKREGNSEQIDDILVFGVKI